MKKSIFKKSIAFCCVFCCLGTVGITSTNAAQLKSFSTSANELNSNDNQDKNNDESYNLPESYNSKNYGYVTSVKKQKYNDCWAYAGLGALESKLLRDGNKIDNLSEEHMNLWATTRNNGTGWQRSIDSAGYAETALGYLTSWQGGVESSDVDNIDFSDDLTGDDAPTNLAKYGVTSIKYVDKTDVNDIKQTIMDCGGLYASYMHNSTCTSSDYLSYFMPESFLSGGIGHAIEVVGWDDNYSKDNFTINNNNTPNNDGAWLIKNSWGKYNSLNGYFWISYEDKYLFGDVYKPCFAIESVQPINDNVRFEQNEIYGATYEFSYIKSSNISFINKFDFSNGYNSLDKVIFETACVGANYTIDYVPFNGKTVSNKADWVTLGNGTVDNKGYICADIDDFDLPVCDGGIAVTIDTSNIHQSNNNISSIGVSEWLNNSDGSYIFKNDSHYDSSFIYTNDHSMDLMKWYKDYYNDDMGGTFVIKAVTNKTDAKVTLVGDVDLNGIVNISDATLIQKYLVGKQELSVVKKLNADVSNDGKITINDATKVQKIIANK